MPGPIPIVTPPPLICLSAYDLATRYLGVAEVAGEVEHNPTIMDMLRRDQRWPTSDETPWCSAFVNHIGWLLNLPRSKSLRARSWLEYGRAIPLDAARIGFDVVVFTRAGAPLDPSILDAPGHVGFYAGYEHDRIRVLGGNQGNAVSIKPYDPAQLLGVRRLYG